MLEETPLEQAAIQARIDHCQQRANDNPMQREQWLKRAKIWQAIMNRRIEDGYYPKDDVDDR